MACQLEFIASPDSFPSGSGEKYPDPKSDQNLAPDKLGCTSSYLGDETEPYFMGVFFWIFAADPRLS